MPIWSSWGAFQQYQMQLALISSNFSVEDEDRRFINRLSVISEDKGKGKCIWNAIFIVFRIQNTSFQLVCKPVTNSVKIRISVGEPVVLSLVFRVSALFLSRSPQVARKRSACWVYSTLFLCCIAASFKPFHRIFTSALRRYLKENYILVGLYSV